MFNNFESKQPIRYSQKFSKLDWEKIIWRHLLKSQKYWNFKELLEFLVCDILLILLV